MSCRDPDRLETVGAYTTCKKTVNIVVRIVLLSLLSRT
jgi:hypothetical protein